MSRHRQSAEQQKREFLQIFYLFDKKGDGKIEIHQLGDACRALGLNPRQDVMKKLVNQLDNERNGARLSFQEFQPIYASLAKETSSGSASDFVDGLRMFDGDGSGLISVTELRHVLTNIGDRLTNKELDDILKEMKIDGGQVNYEEFVRRVMSE